MKQLISILMTLLLLSAFACAKQPQATETAETETKDSVELHPANLAFTASEITDYNDFVCTLSTALVDGTQNCNFSPISAYFALAMAAEGANGKTQENILRLLGCDSLEALRETIAALQASLTSQDGTGMATLCNSLWMNEQYPLREAYQERLNALFDAEAETVDFGSDETSARISDWVAEKTNGLLRPSADAMRFDPATLAVLLNTVYFCDQWATEFKNVQPGTFTRADGTEQTADYLHRFTAATRIYRGDGYLRWSVRLESQGAVTFILPDEGVALSDLLGTPEKLDALMHGGEPVPADVDLLLPRFAIASKFDLTDVLCALGIADAFAPGADFSGMTNVPAYLDRVIQEAIIDVNEKGVKAAAYTEIIEAPTAAEEPEDLPLIEFHLDRPFLFVVEDSNHSPLFVGTVTAPTEHS